MSLWGECGVQVRSSLPPRLAAEHTHTGHVNAYEPPRHQVLKWSQRSYKSVWVGAVGVPVSGINSQTAWATWVRTVTRCLKEVLLLVDIIDIHVWQHCHLIAWDVRGLGFVAHPDADALTNWVHPTVLRLFCSPAGPSAGTLCPCWLRIRGLRAEEHPGWEVAALCEEFGIHSGDGTGVVARILLQCRCGGARVPLDGGHSLRTEEEEQDQHGRPHGLTTLGWRQAQKALIAYLLLQIFVHYKTWWHGLHVSHPEFDLIIKVTKESMNLFMVKQEKMHNFSYSEFFKAEFNFLCEVENMVYSIYM